MNKRDFSDTVKFEVVKNNLEKNNGEIRCEICNKKLASIGECHFDHIEPYAKGGQSILRNCQILCVECNLKKNDKALKDFVLEEKARGFISGVTMTGIESDVVKNDNTTFLGKMTKEIFDQIISEFISKNGDIHKVDFGREYNHLPSVHYVRQYYGDLKTLKKEFGVEDSSLDWSRGTIEKALKEYLAENGELLQKHLTKANKLPSLPCILSYYPEYKNFTDVKRGLCNLEVKDQWTRESALLAGKTFALNHNDKITQKDLHASNNLPTSKVVYKLFGSLAAYQEAVGSEVSKKNALISKDDIAEAVRLFFGNSERIIESQQEFFKSFSISPSTINKRYGEFSAFCKEHSIRVLNFRKAKYTKDEVDDAIMKWVKAGNTIPNSKELGKLGLPSQSVILRFYQDWKEPFYLFEKLFEKVK